MRPQQYPTGAPQWGPPPKKGGNGALIAVLVVVLVLAMGGGGFWLYTELAGDDSDAAPPVDTSKDLKEAPMGCAVLAETDVVAYIPGRMEFEPTGFGSDTELSDEDQCNWGNTDTFSEDGVRPAHVIVTSYLFRARTGMSGVDNMSGVDAAKDHLDRRGRTGGAVGVDDADDAVLIETGDSSADVLARYHNVVYMVTYSNQTEGADVKGGAVQLASVVLGKLVEDDED